MTTTTTQVPERRRDAVARDRYDDAEWLVAHDTVEPLAEAHEQIAGAHAAAVELGKDLFAAFHKQAPRVRAPGEMAADTLINRTVAGALVDSDAVGDLRRFTVANRTQAGLAVSTVVDTVLAEYAKAAAKVAEAEQTAAAAEAEVDDLLARLEALRAEEEPDDDAIDQAQQDLDRAQDDAEKARGDLQDEIGTAAGGVGRLVRKGMRKATEEAEEAVEAFGRWGVDPGELARMDPAARMRLAERINPERVRKIAALLGQLRNLSFGQRKSQWDTLPEEVFDTIVGVDDPAWILPSELMLLADATTEDLFYARLLAGETIGYRLRGRVTATEGGIVMIKDGSGSMVGDRDIFASSLGLALLGIAHDEERAFHGIQFYGPGKLAEVGFPAPADFTTEKMLEWAELAADPRAGTCFETPLRRAVELLDAEHAATGRVTGDIVFLTDGEAAISPAFLTWFKAEQARLRFRIFAFTVGTRASSLEGLVDGMASIQDLHSGADVADLFASLAK